MARLPRLALPAYPHLLMQCGNNREAIVREDIDRMGLLRALAHYAQCHQVALHAWALLPSAFYLLATPSTAEGLPLMMQGIGRSHVRAFNNRYGRTGTLWEGRYKSTLLDPDHWLLPCMAWLDTHAVHAGWVAQPSDDRWSSHGYYSGSHALPISPVPPVQYWALGNTPFARELAYTEYVQQDLAPAQRQALTEAVLHGWPLGSDAFIDQLQRYTTRRLRKGKAGRPAGRSKPVE